MDILVKREIELHQYEIRQSRADVERLIHPSFSEVGKSDISFDFTSIVHMMSTEKPSGF